MYVVCMCVVIGGAYLSYIPPILTFISFLHFRHGGSHCGAHDYNAISREWQQQ